MRATIDLLTLWTDEIETMKAFYRDVLGFPVLQDSEKYVEFINESVRFTICDRDVMREILGEREFGAAASGQIIEFAFPCATAEEVDLTYVDLISRGASPVQPPANMPWNQRTAYFADPDGNIHEIFTDLEG